MITFGYAAVDLITAMLRRNITNKLVKLFINSTHYCKFDINNNKYLIDYIEMN